MKTAGESLIYQFQNGEESAFAEVYHLFFTSIYYYARHYVTDAQEARDITAETFVKLWKLRSNFDHLQKIKTFLHVTARNACIDVLRHQKWKAGKHQQLVELLMDDDESLVSFNTSPMAAATRFVHGLAENDVLGVVYKEIEMLPPQRKLIFKLYYLEGMRNAEIANRLQLSVQTIQNQKTIAIKSLRTAVFTHKPARRYVCPG
ncbi:RNA polymerase sigma-70 factor [Paraflavitalea pollutisoli]|uniref:RNA polymerase sigma-70 factor n=1 Tax=Paraflavitalea pollutisoli TaxID=3034143 RepID=UPI0023EDBA4D|nr:RNA polymerase sigma-70 factor [Paraflavitalea sp. H1-2-19X]